MMTDAVTMDAPMSEDTPGTVADSDMKWFVIQAFSGFEKRVKESLREYIRRGGMEDQFGEIEVPTEQVVELRNGQKRTSERKFFPGYIIVNMMLFDGEQNLVDKVWYFIKEMDGVIGFAGTKGKPIPMRQREVDAMLGQIKEREESVRPAITFETGDTVKVGDGPFEGQNGVIEQIDHETGKLLVSVTIFGRATPVELESWQVENA